MTTQKEKQLTILLLKERLERITGKKVMFKEGVDPKTLKSGQELMVYDDKKKVVKIKFVNVKGNLVTCTLLEPFQSNSFPDAPILAGTNLQFNPAVLTAKTVAPAAGQPAAPPA